MVNRIILLSLLLLAAPLSAAEKGRLADPLRPQGYQVSSATSQPPTAAKKKIEWRLSAVLISTERAVAVINGQSLQVGDRLEGYRVVKIEKSRVVLKNKQKEIVLRRAGTGLKKAFLSWDVEKGSQP